MAAAANSAESAQVTPIGKPFQKGQSGNPLGRPKGVARQFRELVNDDPTKFAEILAEIAESPKAKPEVRIAAIREYLDRGWGKAPSYAPVEDGDPLERDATAAAIARTVDELAARRATGSADGAPGAELAGESKT